MCMTLLMTVTPCVPTPTLMLYQSNVRSLNSVCRAKEQVLVHKEGNNNLYLLKPV